MASRSYALTECFNEIDGGALYYATRKSDSLECVNLRGGGAKFIVTSGDNKYSSCTNDTGVKAESDSGYYEYVYGCSVCSSKEIVNYVYDVKDSCVAQCKLSDFKCSQKALTWNEPLFLIQQCSKIDSTATGCKEETNSSSVEESSSSGEDFSSLRKKWNLAKNVSRETS